MFRGCTRFVDKTKGTRDKQKVKIEATKGESERECWGREREGGGKSKKVGGVLERERVVTMSVRFKLVRRQMSVRFGSFQFG